MPCALVRRGAAARLAAVALTLSPAAFLLAPAAAAGATLTAPSCRVYQDPLDGDVLVGEVQNTGTAASGPVGIDVTWLDSSGTALGPVEQGVTSAVLQRIPAGPAAARANRAPFRATVTPPAGTAGCRVAAVPSDPMGEPNHNFSVALTSRPADAPDANGFRHLTGTVTNNNTTSADDVTVAVTLYGADGKVVDLAVGFPSGSTTTLTAAGTPGATAAFDLPSEGSFQPYTSAVALAESTTAPTTAAPSSPSPSASPAASPSASASPSTSASPSGSPSPASVSPSPDGATPSPAASSASPTPVASPSASTPALPCRVGGGTYRVAAAPSYAKIVKGGRIRLTATVSQAGRLCQAGVRLSLYARGPGTTLYHLSRTATTGSTGRVAFDYAGVRADFRWYVLSSGVRSAINLVQAR